jgi:hypothetical protein
MCWDTLLGRYNRLSDVLAPGVGPAKLGVEGGLGTDQSDERFYSVRLATEDTGYLAEVWQDAPDRWVLLAVTPDAGRALLDLRRPFPSLKDALLAAEALAGHAIRAARESTKGNDR